MLRNISVYHKLVYLFLFIITLSLVCLGPTNIYPDTEGYLNADVYRSLGYPLFIQIHKFIFGPNFLFFIKVSQFVIFFLCVYYFLRSIKAILKINDTFLQILFCIILIPVFYGEKFLNNILTEALTYSLYLAFISLYSEGLFFKNKYRIYGSYIIVLLILQIRSQFLFIIPVLFLHQLILNYKNLLNWNLIKSLLLIVVIPLISSLIDFSYHSLYHNKNTTTPFTGIQIASLPFFVSKKENKTIFNDKDQQAYFDFVYSRLEKRKLLLDNVPCKPYEITDYYFSNYVEIANRTLSMDGETFFANLSSLEDKTIANDKMSISMVIPLIKANFGSYCKMYFQIFMKGIGSSKQFLVYLILLLFFVYKFIKENDVVSSYLVFFILLLLSNIILLTFSVYVVSRYTFYNNWVLLLFIIYLLQNSLKVKNEQDEYV